MKKYHFLNARLALQKFWSVLLVFLLATTAIGCGNDDDGYGYGDDFVPDDIVSQIYSKQGKKHPATGGCDGIRAVLYGSLGFGIDGKLLNFEQYRNIIQGKWKVTVCEKDGKNTQYVNVYVTQVSDLDFEVEFIA